jgi:hypothetical protein
MYDHEDKILTSSVRFALCRFKRTYAPLNLARLQYWIDTGRIDPTQKITMRTLIQSGCVGKLRGLDQGIKILSDGHEWFNVPTLDIEVSQISKKALAAIEAKGGKVKLVYYNRTGMRALLHPERYADSDAEVKKGDRLRYLPYLPPPPEHINKKLERPMVQPDQFPGWLKRQEQLKAQQVQQQ